ncbi:MAG: response regulator [Chloroflexi bacterium]|nr:response regulator [Chloroflexota bacterium]
MQVDDRLLKSMQASFRLEMSERLLSLSQQLATLEDVGAVESNWSENEAEEKRSAAITAILRELHNLKGASRAVNLPQIEELCHASESLLALFNSQTRPDQATNLDKILDFMYQSIAWGDQLLNRLNLGHTLEGIPELERFIRKLQGEEEEDEEPDPSVLEEAAANQEIIPATLEHTAPTKPSRGSFHKSSANFIPLSGENSIRISGAKLDELLAASTELLVARLRMRQHREEIANLLAEGQSWMRLWRTVRGSHTRLVQRASTKGSRRDNDLTSLLHFVELNQQHLKQLEASLTNLHAHFTRDVSYLSFVTDQLQFETRRLRLIPLAVVMEELERVVRQLSRDLGKQVELVVHGAELEVDKKLLDELKAPLLHLLRNALDHGVESPSQRLHNGKPAVGTISISFRQTGRSIELEMRDDGAGIDVEHLKALAVARGLISPAAAAELDQRGAIDFIFHSGFSTREEVSGVSGRGIGLDSVREVATRLGGTIAVDTWPGSGTSFRFSVPNVLVTAEGIVIKSAEQTFVLPVDDVARSFRLSELNVQTIGSRQYLIYNEKQVLLTSLAQVLQLPTLPAALAKGSDQYVVVLQSRGQYGAFTVDSLLKNQEVVVKSFSKPLVRVRRASGATIMADGQVALILNPDELIRSASNQSQPSSAVAAMVGTQGSASANQKNQQRILVVDDSITTRTLEKNILEAAGFYVQTARNGVEAMNHLRAEGFDLVVADLEMPEMDGFQLTRSIKLDQRLADMPVIIVTSLDSAEDKARGMEAGADAYVVKSRFDQQGLLTTIRQLV